jgi:uncharacterized membrane protein
MKQRLMVSLLIVLFWSGTAVSPTPSFAQEQPVVQAVMFWMDGCPHCHEVLDYVLPPLQQQYGDQLDILLVELKTMADTDRLYALGQTLGLAPEEIGVPFLLMGDDVLIGSDQVREFLPDLIKSYLAAGGVAYPGYPELADLLPVAAPPAVNIPFLPENMPTSAPETAPPVEAITESALSEESPTAVRDGFTLAIVILVGMVLALGYTAVRLWQARQAPAASKPAAWPRALLPWLALVGLAVAAYLAYVETQAVTAFCGPVGDCNAVQTSEYAYILGIPIGVLGVMGYLAILATWGWSRWRADGRATFALLGMSSFGVLFSIYLTYLEPFVIGAVCAWCLTSAVVMTLLLIMSVETAVPHMRLAVNGKR